MVSLLFVMGIKLIQSYYFCLVGFNDPKTKFPEIAKEADGWDPSTVLFGSGTEMSWKCREGHQWSTRVVNRTFERDQTGCPSCSQSGFDPEKPSWFYLLARPGEQQLGITNNLPNRMRTHHSNGWTELDQTGPNSGHDVYQTEKNISNGCVKR